MVNFNYQGGSFHFLMNGTDPEQTFGIKPEDKAKEAAVKKLYRPTWIVASIAAAVCLLVGLSTNGHAAWISVLVIELIPVGVLYWLAHKKEKRLLNESSERRQEILRLIQAGKQSLQKKTS
jgi:hypothetical protein